MPLLARSAFVAPAILVWCLQVAPMQADAQACKPSVTKSIIVASSGERLEAGRKAQPPVTDASNGFAWPDTPLGIVKTAKGYEFFGSDGGVHERRQFNGVAVGNNKYGSITTTLGTLDHPLGAGNPQDVSIGPNPDAAVNPNYSSYGYMGGGPVYQIPAGMPGAGYLLATYHAELPNDALYAVLGLAASEDNGLHWTDLGEIVRLNQAYAPGLDGFEIGDGPLVLSPDGSYFYLYFPDWLPNGSVHATTINNVAVARAPVSSVLAAAFGERPQHTVPFEKFYAGTWNLQPGIGGASTERLPNSPYQGYLDIHYNSVVQRYLMIISNDTAFGLAESTDGLTWTSPVGLGTYGPIAAYPTAVGLGSDPHVLGKSFYVYYTHLPTDGTGWQNGALRRFTVTCS
jgi:hypothetical protein